MPLLPITLYGDKILRKKTEQVSDVDMETVKLIKDMFDTMRNASGIGLAANQVGADKQIFIVDLSGVEGFENAKPMVFINPKFEKFDDEKVIIEEGCLSIPDVRADVERPKKVTLVYYDTDMKEQKLEADELLARVVQHEFDHLQGILFTDKISDEMKKKLKKDLNDIKHRKVEFEYPVTDNMDYQLL
ncbi:MAG TPA: peptide deformylase [Ignavibacteriaceae bacterium]|nr:peptide deformylase [Ignavibacteriaceae bacterium]